MNVQSERSVTPAFQQPAPVEGSVLQRKCDCGSHSRGGGGCRTCSSGPKLHRKSNSDTASFEAPPIVHDVLRSAGQPLRPESRGFFESRFGHDFSGVRVHTDSRAAESASAVNAAAYTVGQHIVFGPGQHRQTSDQLPSGGVPHSVAGSGGGRGQLPAQLFVGAADSIHEREADAMADRVLSNQNRPAGDKILAHELAHVSQASADAASVVRRYTIYSSEQQEKGRSNGWMHPSEQPLMVADTGEMAVEHKPWRSQMAWARPGMITQANQILEDQGSFIRLRPGSEETAGRPPDGSSAQEITLSSVEVINPSDEPGTLRGDCGHACLQTMGAHGRKEFTGVMRRGGRTLETPAVGYRGGHGPGSDTTTNELSGHMFQTIMREEFGQELSLQAAREAYDRLSADRKDEIDKKYGLNKYAIPEIGQGMTTGTEFNMPGFKDDRELKRNRNMRIGGLTGLGGGILAGGLIGLATGGLLGLLIGGVIGGLVGGGIGLGIGAGVDVDEENTWNFHFATAILKSGRDYVTIENVAGRRDTDWLFMMYGPTDKGQSFHDFQSADEHGNKSTSMVVKNPDL